MATRHPEHVSLQFDPELHIDRINNFPESFEWASEQGRRAINKARRTKIDRTPVQEEAIYEVITQRLEALRKAYEIKNPEARHFRPYLFIEPYLNDVARKLKLDQPALQGSDEWIIRLFLSDFTLKNSFKFAVDASLLPPAHLKKEHYADLLPEGPLPFDVVPVIAKQWGRLTAATDNRHIIVFLEIALVSTRTELYTYIERAFPQWQNVPELFEVLDTFLYGEQKTSLLAHLKELFSHRPSLNLPEFHLPKRKRKKKTGLPDELYRRLLVLGILTDEGEAGETLELLEQSDDGQDTFSRLSSD